MSKLISLIIPCYNEEEGIGRVLDRVPYTKMSRLGYDIDVIVVDNNSRDKTGIVASEYGARVVYEPKQGKGYALIRGFLSIRKETDIVVMIDGDNTYSVIELLRLIEPIDSNFSQVVVGSRLHGKISKDSMSYFNRVGNWLFTFLVRLGYKANVTDVCSGFFAWHKDVIDALLPHLESNGFSIEMEMIVKMARLNYYITSVPISYDVREGHSSLHPVRDGSVILYTWMKHLAWKPPAIISDKKIAVPGTQET